MRKSTKNVRLASHVKPERYQIALKPDLDAFVFEGEETITLTLDKKVKEITLHSAEIEIESVFVLQNKVKTFATKISYDKKAETATFVFQKTIDKGKAKLTLLFRGILNDRMQGFYRSRYEVAGKEYYMATTQFEATDARRAFPCFDEPSLKSVFEVKLIVPTKSTALSNTIPISIKEHSAGYQVVEFSPTPKMSTYLAAFIVGDLEHVERKTKEGVLVRVFTTPGKIHQAEFALDCAVKTLSFFTKYFDIPYPMPVLDMVAIPDFSSGAMENWGAITYREAALLIDPDHSSQAMKQRVAVVVAHELAHQWFGNLVTMEWWTHLWLNEGFASYIEYLAVDHLFPEWEMWTEFVSEDLGRALSLDSLKHTHPIEVSVNHPDEISEIFDAVSYSKGASVIRMLADYLGDKDFRDGLRYYLKKHSYKNAETFQLWEALEKVSRKPVSKIMGVWTGKGGHPILDVSEKEGVLTIEQRRFFASPISKQNTKDTTIWPVPISIRVGNSTKVEKFLLASKKIKISEKENTWVKLNVGETGVYRTNYSAELLKLLGEAIERGELSVVDRLGLLRDVFDLAHAGEMPTVRALDFVSHYKHETSYVVWGEIISGLSRVHRIIFDELCAPEYRKFVLEILQPMIKKVGWKKKTGERHTETLVRGLILGSAGVYGDTSTIEKARTLFAGLTIHKNKIPPDLRSVVYGTVARHGGVREYEKLLTMYKKAELHEEKNRIGAALGQFKDKDLLQKTLDFSISSHVRAQETARFTSVVTMNVFAGDIGWRFIKKHWKFILKQYGDQKDLTYFIDPLGSYQSNSVANDIENFFKKNSVPGGARAVEQALESIRAKAIWDSRDKKNVAKWILARKF